MKTLPILNAPSLVATLPISKHKVKYRPFVVGEQHALVLAKRSEDQETAYETITDVLSTCTGNSIDIKSIPLADLSYLFLQIRIASVGEDVQVTTKCDNSECNGDILINLHLSNANVTEVKNNKIMLTPEIGIIMKYPVYGDTLELSKVKSDPVAGVYHLVDSIFDEETVYDKNDYTLDEFKKWFLSMTEDQLSLVYDFINSLPELVYDLKYTCPNCSHEHSKRLEGLHTFFRFGSR